MKNLRSFLLKKVFCEINFERVLIEMKFTYTVLEHTAIDRSYLKSYVVNLLKNVSNNLCPWLAESFSVLLNEEKLKNFVQSIFKINYI